MKYKLIIFDLDDTLIDYTSSEMNAIKNICNTFGINNADCYRIYRESSRIARTKYPNLDHENLSRFRMERIGIFLSLNKRNDISSQQFLDLYIDEMSNGILFDDVVPCLKSLKDRCTIVVGTNGDNKTRLNKLKTAGISEYFSEVYTSEMLKCSKPSPDFFLKIIKEYPFNLDEILVVGDDYEKDFVGARHTGIDCCLIKRGLKEGFNTRIKPQYLISTLSELLPIIENN